MSDIEWSQVAVCKVCGALVYGPWADRHNALHEVSS